MNTMSASSSDDTTAGARSSDWMNVQCGYVPIGGASSMSIEVSRPPVDSSAWSHAIVDTPVRVPSSMTCWASSS